MQVPILAINDIENIYFYSHVFKIQKHDTTTLNYTFLKCFFEKRKRKENEKDFSQCLIIRYVICDN